MDKARQNLVVEPRWISIDEISVSADIHLDQANHRWEVTVILSQPPDTGSIQGYEIDAQFLDESNNAMRQEKRPLGPLPETAEELRSAADARFQFRANGHLPAHLLVICRDQRIKFRVVHN